MKKKVCSSCGFENDPNKKFCVSCGKNLEAKMVETAFCPECGERLEEGSLFCASCGTKVISSEEKDILEPVEDDEKQEGVEDSMDNSSLDEDVSKEVQEKEERADIDSIEEDIEAEEEKFDFCPECGEKLEKGTLFCVSCGTKIGASEDAKKDDSNVEQDEKKVVITNNSSKGDEEKKKKKRILILILILLLIAMLASFYYFFFYKPSHGSKKPEVKNEEKLISVPNVVDKSGKEAIGILQDLSFEVRIVEEEIEDTKKVGLVFEQEPSKGKLKKNSEITIKIYISNEKVEMVLVTGDTLEEAQEKLNNLGVTTKVVEESSDTVEKGKIISQNTKEGEEVSKGGTVTIIVSTGKEENNEEGKKEDSKKPTPTPKSTKSPEITQNPTSKPTPSEKTPNPKPTSTPGSWSGWGTSLPSGVTSKKYDIETKTQYRVRMKQTTNSTSSSLSGWTLYDTKVEPTYSGMKTTKVGPTQYNSFKNNANYQIISDEILNFDIVYLYCSSKLSSSSSASITLYRRVNADKTCDSGFSLIGVKETKEPKGNLSVGTYVRKKIGNLETDYFVSNIIPSDRSITYKEKTGEKTTYYYYRWDHWSAWQDVPLYNSETAQVETRTLYRYRTK